MTEFKFYPPGCLKQYICEDEKRAESKMLLSFSFFFQMWEAGSKQLKDSFNSYGRIDLFRPYFDVEPIQVNFEFARIPKVRILSLGKV